ncbi:hypothetical protein BJY21_001739 [Kineosphaera limosa]|uniref:Uncharacterized protein n=1 Tax=Kineosphaera limosa NBRC 100340 TaxID=1184609 RepID=K6X842_9MICO|nr:hypothetical protein [Kineosphaera limosa]NYE00555.1 hypothetical protein [Kineosphaera limosa]GAB94979.1 hypothetical protein KILIM_015_00390 [Kineosphaera limosa NBRC 100340]
MLGTGAADHVDLFKAGVDVADVADEFAISTKDLQQALRGHLSLAAACQRAVAGEGIA